MNFLVERAIRNLVTQGNHQEKIVEHLRDFIKVFREEFPEDNKVTQDAFLRECLETALEKM
jgi:hypothetical protein